MCVVALQTQVRSSQTPLILLLGEEAIHIRDGSSHFLIQGNTIENTGLSEPGYGEGIYIGSDKSVHSYYNQTVTFVTITDNYIGPNVRAESIDVKEGTHDVSKHHVDKLLLGKDQN